MMMQMDASIILHYVADKILAAMQILIDLISQEPYEKSTFIISIL